MRYSLLISFLAATPSCFGQYNGSTLTASGQLDSAVSQIAASYFPSSIQPSLAVALASASVTGDYRAIVSSLITAAAPPPYITDSALAPYASRISKAESIISSLQQAAFSATHTTPNTTIGGNATIAITTTETAANGTSFVTTIPAQVVNGSTITSGATAGATGANGGSSTGSTPASTPSGSGSSSSSKGFATPTEVPIAAAGIVGLLGALAAL